jgi:hypothetical protein
MKAHSATELINFFECSSATCALEASSHW